jgi:hypothetical protein
VLAIGIVNLFGDVTYEGGASMLAEKRRGLAFGPFYTGYGRHLMKR